VNLGDLIDFVGNLLDYDPTNTTYREQLVSLLNDAQTHILTDRPWPFAMKDRELVTFTDLQVTLNFTAGSAQVTGVGFEVNPSTVTPGSRWTGGEVTGYTVAGVEFSRQIAWVKSSTELYLTRPWSGATQTVVCTLKRRKIHLPSDCMTIQNVSDPSVGIPAKALFLSQWEQEDTNLDPDLLGTIEAYLPSEAFRVPAPRNPVGNGFSVSAVTVPAGQGVRTINVYMVNVFGPNATNFKVYPSNVSDGFESALSKVETFNLSDTQTLYFKPEPLDPSTGLWRRFYFTCPEAGILAPVRIRHIESEQVPGFDTGADTAPPDNPTFGGLEMRPNLALSYLSSQAFGATSIRYRWNNSAAYRSIELYPHPSEDQEVLVRMLLNPRRLQEDQDSPLVPHAYAQLIAFAALENLTLKVDNPALSQVYLRKKETLFKAMEQAYLKATPRRIIKGNPTAGYKFVRNPFGKLTFS